MPLIQDDHLPNVSSLHVPRPTSRPLPHSTRIRNRRKRYLERRPSYFSPDLESADPLLYDRLVRRFFTPTDRQIERRQKGYAATLEADLLRSEAKLDEAHQLSLGTNTTSSDTSAYADGGGGGGEMVNDTTYIRTATGQIIAQRNDEEGLSREEAYERWYEVMERRFLDGNDKDFDYAVVDGNEEYDDVVTEERERQEDWFEDEEPSGTGEGEAEENARLEGETGIQDF